jgi:hypothetical protein
VVQRRFLKKIDMHMHALSLYFVFYNFTRKHKAHRLSPAWPLASRIGCGAWKTLSRADRRAWADTRTAKPLQEARLRPNLFTARVAREVIDGRLKRLAYLGLTKTAIPKLSH